MLPVSLNAGKTNTCLLSVSHSKQDDGCVGGDNGGGGTCWSANDETTTSTENGTMAMQVGEAAMLGEIRTLY